MTRLHPAQVLTAAAALCVFLPALVVPYAFSDDYMLLSIADGQGPNPYFGNHITDFATANGRPFQGVLIGPVFAAAGTIDNLRFVRLIGVVGIVALALLLQSTLVRSQIRPGLAGVIAVFVCTLPAFQVYASWAVLFSSPYAALFAAISSLIVVGAIDLPWRLALDRYVCATALLVVSLLTYQPAAMFFWLFLAVALIGAVGDSQRARRLVAMHLVLGGSALALGFLGVKLGARYVGPTSDTFRNRLTTDVVGKARWFFNQPLYHSLNFSNLTYSRWLAGAAVVLMVTGIPLLLWKRRVTRPWIYIGTAIGLVPLSYLPNLVVREDWATFRTQVALSSLLALYTVLGSIGVWLTVRDWLARSLAASTRVTVERAVIAVGVGAVATSAFLASKNVTTLFALPSNTELRAIRSQVAALPTGQPRVGFALTPSNEGLATFHVYDEFGVASSSLARVAQAVVWLVLQEEGRLTTEQHPVVDVFRYPASPPSGEPLVNVFPTIQSLR